MSSFLNQSEEKKNQFKPLTIHNNITDQIQNYQHIAEIYIFKW